MNSVRVLCADKYVWHFIMNALICLTNDLIRIGGYVDCTVLIMVGYQAAQILVVNQGVLLFEDQYSEEVLRKFNQQILTEMLQHD